MEGFIQKEDVSELYLELDYKNIPSYEYYNILLILKHCPSLVDEEIISISEEIIHRMHTNVMDDSRTARSIINSVYTMLHGIPDTKHLIEQIKNYYQSFINSPSISPVSSPQKPKLMKKMKVKSYDYGDDLPFLSTPPKPKVMTKMKVKSYLCPPFNKTN
tara:strand:+ start:207 stop:686 length:480 start_codon:yes stop_codon:yes gene_type:complete